MVAAGLGLRKQRGAHLRIHIPKYLVDFLCDLDQPEVVAQATGQTYNISGSNPANPGEDTADNDSVTTEVEWGNVVPECLEEITWDDT